VARWLVAAWCLLAGAGCGGAEPDPSARASERRLVAIDVGHGSGDPGATSARGVPEYRFNSRLAREVQGALEAADFETVLINGDGTLSGDLGLAARTRIANAADADLFVSIHHDSVQERYLRAWSFEGKTRRHSDRFAGYSVFYSASSPQAERSLGFANLLADELRDRGLSPSLHHAEDIEGERRHLVDPDRGIYQADFWVIKSTTMPAVLLEAGIVVNRDEEERLERVAYRRRIVDSIVAATRRFCKQEPYRRRPK
jgi:N-acetylmuramoyl-L-alanine amidase